MSDDLISRKETEQILRAYADDVGCNRGEYELANGILKAVSRVIDPEIVPTAYDAEKVIEQLKEEAKYSQYEANEVAEKGDYGQAAEFEGMVKSYKYAIEIVKSGGAENGN